MLQVLVPIKDIMTSVVVVFPLQRIVYGEMVKLRVLLFVLQSVAHDQLEEKQSKRLTAAILNDCRLENIECRKHQLIFVTTSHFVPG